MSWFNVWDDLKNKTCRYLLHRYLGQFLDERLNLEQLKVELYDGKATVENVSLKVEALNELFEAQGWAFEVTSGHIGLLKVSVPWNALMTNDSSIEASDITISLRPIKREDSGTSMLESMWSSVSSTMQLAEECLKLNEDGSKRTSEVQSNTIAGLEKFAETIDNVLNRIKAKFTNTLVRLEYPLKGCSKAIAIIIKIHDMNYKNETENKIPQTKLYNDNEESNRISEDVHHLRIYTKHNITIKGFHIFTEELLLPKCNTVTTSSTFFSQKIPILQINDQQNIQIKIKQSEDISGPKVSFDIELGSIYTLLSPRQVHLLIRLFNAFNEHEMQRNTLNQYNDPLNFEKENNSNKFEFYKSQMTGTVDNPNNWIFQEESVNHAEKDNIQSNKKCYESFHSSESSSNIYKNVPKIQRKTVNIDSSGEISNFIIKITGFTGIFLHEDISTGNRSTGTILRNLDKLDMLTFSEMFFCNLQPKSFEEEPKSYISYCNKNHILLRLQPIFADGKQERKKDILQLDLAMSATKADFCEVLEERITPLLSFNRNENCFNGHHKRPEVCFNTKFTFDCVSKDRNYFLDIIVENCVLELDISVYDRLGALFGTSPFADNTDVLKPQSTNTILNADSIFMPRTLTEANITCRKFELKLRFPIVDVRPLSDPDRVPWWKQNIRQDFLLFIFTQLRCKYCPNILDLVSTEIDGFYHENGVGNEVHILKARRLTNNDNSIAKEFLECPQILIELDEPIKSSSSGEELTAPSIPFCSKRTCRQSATRKDTDETESVLLPGNTQEINNFCDSTMSSSKIRIKINLPIVDLLFGSKQIYEVIYNRLNSDLFMWEPCSPFHTNFLHCGVQNFRNAHNEGPSDSIYISSMSKIDSSEENVTENLFRGSKSGKNMKISNMRYQSGKVNTTIDDNFNDYEEFVTYLTPKEKSCLKSDSKKTIKTSYCSVELKIGKGSFAFYVPVRDADNHVLPGLSGKFMFLLNNIKVFSVCGYKSDMNMGYLCVQINDVKSYHRGVVPMNSTVNLDEGLNVENFMRLIFYKVSNTLTKEIQFESKYKEMVCIVTEIKKQPDEKIKRLKMTTGIRKVTHQHNPADVTHNWFHQLVDFFNISEYPIEGYKPFSTVTEIQLHLWDCVIDYRPIDFGFRAVTALNYFTVSSNIISTVSGCNVCFILEECVFSIAPQDNTDEESKVQETISTKLNNLIPVLEIGLVDISLRINEKVSEKFPKFDLRFSIHDVHLRTCSDSGSALAQLIAYIVSDSDVSAHNKNERKQLHQSSICSENNLLSSTSKRTQYEVSEEQQERVNLLVAEAVQETVSATNSDQKCTRTLPDPDKLEVFYFPDESKKCTIAQCAEVTDELYDILNYESNVMNTSYSTNMEYIEEPLPQVKSDLGTITVSKMREKRSSHHDEDFCIVTNDDENLTAHFGIQNLEIPEDPLRIVDNHFCLPTESNDLLRPPENFPMPLYRYTLCEMAFTWHLYGGRDFPGPLDGVKETGRDTDTYPMSDVYRHGVSDAKVTEGVRCKKPKDKITWKSVGGIHRNHEVLVEIQFSKVRFTYELYPPYTNQASRQVLLVKEIEIRDRLQSSQINKFLYSPGVKSSSKYSHHMVVIKALHVRSNPRNNTSEECSLRISLSPMRLHIDQITLEFLVDFFTQMSSIYNLENICKDSKGVFNKLPLTHKEQSPIMSVNDEVCEAIPNARAQELVTANPDFPRDDMMESESKCFLPTNKKPPIYFREVIFSPEVPICFDYHGHRVELSKGPITGLLMGLGQLQCSEIRLRKITYRHGILGCDKLFIYLCKEWLKDIKRNQLPKILSGVGPTYAFVQLFQGIYDLFWLPIEQYQKGGRIVRGLQLGAQSFSVRTILAVLEITSRVIQLLQFTAETAFDMVSAGPSVKYNKKPTKGKKKRTSRPKDIREGVANAFNIVKEGINDSANTLIETAVTEHDQKGLTGAVGAVMRQVPQLVVCPAVLATQATTNILGGMKSSFVPEAKVEAREKWKHDNC